MNQQHAKAIERSVGQKYGLELLDMVGSMSRIRLGDDSDEAPVAHHVHVHIHHTSRTAGCRPLS